MRKLRFVKADPCGNTTLFVLDPCPRGEYGEIARALMGDRALCAQQVGFLAPSTLPGAPARLEMMGGEFCGNASRSFAAWLAMGGLEFLQGGPLDILPLTEPREVLVEASGHRGLLAAFLEGIGSPLGCSAQVDMPLPRLVRHGESPGLGPYSAVGFEGISHLILWDKGGDPALLDPARELLARHGMDPACFGVMFLEGSGGAFLRPLVAVEAAGSLVWESSCGSGSLAVAAALADRRRASVRQLIAQPGGELRVAVELSPTGGFARAQLAGDVFFPAVGTAYLA